MSILAVHQRLHRPCHSRWGCTLVRLTLLLSFLAVKGLAPAGYMLGDASQPWRYMPCHGDAASVQAFGEDPGHQGQHSDSHVADHEPHHQPQHHRLTVHAAEEAYCAFAVLAGATLVPEQQAPDLVLAPAGQVSRPFEQRACAHPIHLRPLPRAPPIASAQLYHA